jgi:CRISPR-associated endonuclease/helicase Cas3
MPTELYSHPNKSLIQHLEAVADSAEKAIASIPWTDATLGQMLQHVARIIGLYHDIGKGTTYFQEYLAGNMNFNKQLKNHALLSSIATFIALQHYLSSSSWGSPQDREIMASIGYYVVRQHHGDLGEDILEALSVEDKNQLLHKQIAALDTNYFVNLPYWDVVSQAFANSSTLFSDDDVLPLLEARESLLNWKEERLKGEPDLDFYLISEILSSVLLNADKLDASETSVPLRPQIQLSTIDAFRRQKFGASTGTAIENLRDWAYKTAVEHGSKDASHHICSLSLPTGSGKTLAALGYALALREQLQQKDSTTLRIIYALPFISIIDQNYEIFQEIFAKNGESPSSDVVLSHTHLSDEYQLRRDEKDDSSDVSSHQKELLVEGWESEIVVTTFVQLFSTFFSGRNRPTRRLAHIAGSIVILDEVQTFPHEYWLLFQKFAEAMARLTGTYFLLCTATQPAIFESPHELAINPPSVSTGTPRTELLWKADKSVSVMNFVEQVLKDALGDPGRYLLVLNTVGSAEQTYRLLRKQIPQETPITFLSTYVCPVERQERINSLHNKPTSLEFVVSTQLIEAGVNIDNHKAYRDFAPLDSIIQVAGRVNRNAERETEQVIIVSLQDGKNLYAQYIYDPVLLRSTREILSKRQAQIPETDYAQLSSEYYKAVNEHESNDKSRKFLSSLSTLDFSILQNFSLINKDRPQISVFIELNDQATEVLNAYRAAMVTTNSWQRKEQWNAIKSTFLQFVVNVPLDIFKETGLPMLEGSDSFFYLPSNQLKTFYDPVTGFKSDTSVHIW